MRVSYCIILISLAFVSFVGCKKTEDLIDFTEEDEVLLGEKLAQAISENANFSLIPSEGNSLAYGYVNSRLSEITNAASISKSEDFTWSVTLFDDETRQAFALPGGYIYVSTGMIFYLANEDQFSGLLAHLVAHIDQSHVTERLFFKYGVNGLKSITTGGDAESLNQIIGDLDLRGTYLQLSRANELVADTLAISLLTGSGQACNSNGLFMDRALNVQAELITSFTGAHRLDTIRLGIIEETVIGRGCDTTVDGESDNRFISFRNSLP
ncbi:M48 family metalloprotease [Ekhidna sp.]|uniref:M48 family metalloprotease n=1 Tax=Ekhidna sp. TaxID=2608089 RepID=UPI003B5CCFC5